MGWKKNQLLKRFIFSLLLLFFLVVPGSALATAYKTLLSDDFHDNVIDGKKWITRGYNVSETDGILKITQDVTNNGGYVESVGFDVNPTGMLTLTRKTYLHYANNTFYPGLVFTTDLPARDNAPETYFVFGVLYNNYSYSGTESKGFYLFKNNSRMNPENVAISYSNQIAPVWDQWFNEKIDYNPASGLMTYYINDVLQMEYNVGSLEGKATKISVSTTPYGWNTGHYQYTDDILIKQISIDFSSFQINNTTTKNIFPKINNRGQIVWLGSDKITNTYSDIYDIFLYDINWGTNEAIKLNDVSFNKYPNYYDPDVSINDKGQITWSAGDGNNYYIYVFDTNLINEVPHKLSPVNININYRPIINNSGEIVWIGNSSLYYCNTNMGYNNIKYIDSVFGQSFDFNDNGILVYEKWNWSDGKYELFYYDARKSNDIAHRITNNDRRDVFPKINNNNQVVWRNGFMEEGDITIYFCDLLKNDESVIFISNSCDVIDINNSHIILSNEIVNVNNLNDRKFISGIFFMSNTNNYNKVASISDDAIYYMDLNDDYIQRIEVISSRFFGIDINDRDQIAYSLNNGKIGVSEPSETHCLYEFGFYFNQDNQENSDYYKGLVYAPKGYSGYGIGYRKPVIDEEGNTGYYEITAVTDLGTEGSRDGQVYITSYYDVETNQTITPVNYGTVVGAGYTRERRGLYFCRQ